MSIDRTVVVTGASTGIGWGIAKVLLGKGFQVIGSVRREQDAERLRKEFGAGFTPVMMDITDQASVIRAAEETALLSSRPN